MNAQEIAERALAEGAQWHSGADFEDLARAYLALADAAEREYLLYRVAIEAQRKALDRLWAAADRAWVKAKHEYDSLGDALSVPTDDCWAEFEALRDAVAETRDDAK